MPSLLHQAYFLCKQGSEAHKAMSLDQLQLEFPTADYQEIVSAFDRATKLIEAGGAWAEQKRGPNNDGEGTPTVDLENLCPGFSPGIYSDAQSWGLYLTK